MSEIHNSEYQPKFYGKYRAIVKNVDDPLECGRIQVACPKVLGEYLSNWCMPCIPFLGEGEGMIKIPRVGDGVWIEFEDGDLDSPIWVGGWSTPKNTPFFDYKDVDKRMTFRTKAGHLIEINNNGDIGLSLWCGAELHVKQDRVTIKGDLLVTGEVKPNTPEKDLNKDIPVPKPVTESEGYMNE